MDDFATGLYTLGGLLQGTPDMMFVYEIGTTGPPCPVDPPTNPSPPNGASNIPLTGNTATWTNGAGTVYNEVWFGEAGSLVQVYDGPAITSFSLAPVEPLNYWTDYAWRIISKNDTCGVMGPLWTFKTLQDPNLIFFEEFNDLTCWTPIGPLGMTNWTANNSNNATGTAPELRLSWTPSFDGLSKLVSCDLTTIYPNEPHPITFKHYVDNYSGDPSPELGIGISYDNGATYTTIWSVIPPAGGINVGPETINETYTPTSSPFQFVFFANGNSFNINYWYVDDLLVVEVPVELTSFTATAIGPNVTLNWTTATETNNQGFHIERSNGGEFTSVGFVAGYGTTSETQNYSFVDRNVQTGTYSYRLKQVDYDGTFEYSDVVEVEVGAPAEFALDQNYPNPFNPSTKINFRLAADSKVSLKVFDVLGQEVMTLINNDLSAGSHQVEFDASNLNSGVYFYKIEATGNNGTNFSDVKKMILTK
jgi:hypothetical protein